MHSVVATMCTCCTVSVLVKHTSTVPLKCKLTVSTRNSILKVFENQVSRLEFRFSRFENRISRIEFRVSRHSKNFSRISNREFEETI